MFPQPGDDIVFMAQTLEKIFLHKLSQMPQEEFEVASTAAKDPLKGKKTSAGILRINKYKFWFKLVFNRF